jgi:hypothetical protein
LRQGLARTFYNRACLVAVIWRTQPYIDCDSRQYFFVAREHQRIPMLVTWPDDADGNTDVPYGIMSYLVTGAHLDPHVPIGEQLGRGTK